MGGGAIGSGVIVDLSSLNEIGRVDSSAKRISVGPGALRADVNAAAAKQGLRFPVDPSSGSDCTIGGMVSTNAGGVQEGEGDGFYIRDGIVVIVKNAEIPDGTVI